MLRSPSYSAEEVPFKVPHISGNQMEQESSFVPEEPITHVVQVSTSSTDFFEDDTEPFCSELMPGLDDMSSCREKTEPETEVRNISIHS